MNVSHVPHLITPGVIAAKLGVPLHRVNHVLATRSHIRPAARAGTLRLYTSEIINMVREELADIESQRDRREARSE